MVRGRSGTQLAAIVAGLGVLALGAPVALAGGFEIREQSAFFSGTAYAGTAAGGSSLSSIFWNPATSSFVGNGFTTDSSYTLVLPNADLHVTGGAILSGADPDVDIGRDAVIPASYIAWRYNDKTVFALSTNSPFGLTTKPDNVDWAGAPYATTSKVASYNFTPSVSYQLTPHISVGVGLQLQYAQIKALDADSYHAEFDDFAVGGTAGINVTPFRGTSIGLGYRSRLQHDFEGDFTQSGVTNPANVTLETPDKVTLSLRQELASHMRLLGSVDWTNWSVTKTTPVFVGGAKAGSLPFGWEDGWSVAVGGEYDWSPKLTLRGGVNFEHSPIQDDTARLIQLPDSDRVWFGLGASYAWSDKTTINLSYLHVELEKSSFSRVGLNETGLITGTADVNADAISVGVTMKADTLADLLPFGH